MMNVVGETRSRAVVVVSKNKGGCTALYSFYFMFREVQGFRVGEAYSKWGRMMALYVVSLMFSWHIWRFLLHKFKRLVAFF